ncbi:alanine racemase [Paenibacillus profundus]|uniref:Alanine racemase n=1 Tax=Paenibacillus profundus TaxID=1173085 RepID=A0ABS8YDA4_9BACL|nr:MULTISPECIES: alanine racemase [Paenibacillus]MCE5168859.1 alanine racemase [Paenibacillus profundus]
METYFRPTRAEISLDALHRNMQAFRDALPAATRLSVCVKANAYGHGAVEVARAAERFGVDYLNVAFLEEAIQLRRAGVRTPILILGYTPPEGVSAAYQYNITLNIFSEECIRALEAEASSLSAQHGGRILKIHVKIDSGMGRLGIRTPGEAISCIERLNAIPGVEVEGVFTHFACADEADKRYSELQTTRFQAVLEALAARHISIPIIHASNSAAAIDMPGWSYDMVRVGVSIYGLYPSIEVNRSWIELEPVLTLKTKVVHTKTVPPGEGISYGVHYYTSNDERIATMPIGYADGYSRLLSGKASMLIRGQRVPVIGRICMDQCMVSLQPLGEAAIKVEAGEEAVLIGSQGQERITVEEIAEHLGTINYEVVCMLAHRVPRLYMAQGKPVQVLNPLCAEPLAKDFSVK